MTEPTIKTLAAQVPAELADELAELAKLNSNSVSAEIRRALKAHVSAEWARLAA